MRLLTSAAMLMMYSVQVLNSSCIYSSFHSSRSLTCSPGKIALHTVSTCTGVVRLAGVQLYSALSKNIKIHLNCGNKSTLFVTDSLGEYKHFVNMTCVCLLYVTRASS